GDGAHGGVPALQGHRGPVEGAAAGAYPGSRVVAGRPVRLRQVVAAGVDGGDGDRPGSAGAGDRCGPVRVQRPVLPRGGPAVVVDHMFDQAQMSDGVDDGLVVVVDGARDVVAIDESQRASVQAPSVTGPFG